ncbi:hypothetical protein L1887_57035 [Cichorium endivia]|nr:hypothetical protein L1887_57035 [Cichorium endivia]
MTAWSTKQPEENELNAGQPAQAEDVAQRALAIDTQGQRGPTASTERTQAGPAHPPPPMCMQNCISSIEACTQDIARFNERVEQNRVDAEAQRRESGDPAVARKAIIPLVFVILSWVFLVFVWRLCSRMIQQTPQGVVLGTRSEGIGLLVGFVVLWLMTMWSYVTVISKGPGHVKDYVPESAPPLPGPHDVMPWNQGAAPQCGPQQQHLPQPLPIPTQHAGGHSNIPASESSFAHSHGLPSSNSLPYPSFNADLERFGGNRASSDSMRVLPGSVEPKHDMTAADLSHSRNFSQRTIAEEEEGAADTSAVDVEAQLRSEPAPATEGGDVASHVDPQLPGILGPLAAATIAEGDAMREATDELDRARGNVDRGSHTEPAAEASAALPGSSGWSAPQRQPPNDPPPLSAAAQYCHRCKRVKPPRAHHCRRCGTCVLKMDHHCPWVGGCVGAHNQRFFFIFVLWVTLLEVYTLATTAVYFHRGVRALSSNSPWQVDGFLVSLFPICAVFLIFTGALLGTHVFLMAHNMTTIEHVGVNRMQGRERVLVDRWFGMQANSSAKTPGFGAGLKAKRQMIRDWDREWGKLTKEGNRWWLGSSSEAEAQEKSAAQDAQTGAQHEDGGSIHAAHEKHVAEGKRAGNQRVHGAFRTNTAQALGSSMWMWFLPIGKHPNDGLDFPMNPRFGPQGVWRKRPEWPEHLQ